MRQPIGAKFCTMITKLVDWIL